VFSSSNVSEFNAFNAAGLVIVRTAISFSTVKVKLFIARAFGMKASVPFFKLMNMRQVTIAAVNGFALGGGCGIQCV